MWWVLAPIVSHPLHVWACGAVLYFDSTHLIVFLLHPQLSFSSCFFYFFSSGCVSSFVLPQGLLMLSPVFALFFFIEPKENVCVSERV